MSNELGPFARLGTDWAFHGVKVWLGTQAPGATIFNGPGGRGSPQVFRDAEFVESPEPTLVMGNDHALLLLRELDRHFGGAEDMRSLRRDYDAERKRVDTLTEAILAKHLGYASVSLTFGGAR